MSDIENLLMQVSSINNKYEEILKLTGENFNIFKTLRLTTNEVRTHSAFLCELLNRNGSHGLNEIFLMLFINLQKEKFIRNKSFTNRFDNFDVKSSIAKAETSTTDGRIDILITDNFKNIILENKINARDQPKQLVKYHKVYEDAPIFYLTLDEKQPSTDSKGDLEEGNNFVCISYEADILKWLEMCKEKTVNHPLIRETLTQYINLIKQLTNQTTNNKMSQEIVNQVINGGHIETAIEIGKNLKEIKKKIMAKFSESLIKLAHERDMEVRLNDSKKSFGLRETALIFSKKGLKYDVQFYLESDFESVTIGISDENDKWYKNEHEFFKTWENWTWTEVYSGIADNDIINEILEYFRKIEKYNK